LIETEECETKKGIIEEKYQKNKATCECELCLFPYAGIIRIR